MTLPKKPQPNNFQPKKFSGLQHNSLPYLWQTLTIDKPEQLFSKLVGTLGVTGGILLGSASPAVSQNVFYWEADPNLPTGYTPNGGAQWDVDDTSRTYSNVGGSGINVNVQLLDPDDRNLDSGNKPSDNFVTETNSSIFGGPGLLSAGMTSQNSNQEVSFVFTFSQPVLLQDFLVGDIDSNGDNRNPTSTGGYQDEVVFSAEDQDGNNVPITLSRPSGFSDSNSNVRISGQIARSEYDIDDNLNVQPANQAGHVLANPQAAITQIRIDYSNGPDDDGVSDDHAIMVGLEGGLFQFEAAPSDFSDAPADGSTPPNGSGTTGYGEASHIIVNGTRLGANIDAETAAQNTADADGDDNNGTDDDDGVTIDPLAVGQTATITADVAGAGGYLQGWIDWNGNGSFEGNEQVATDIQDNGTGDTDNTTGKISFDVSVPVGAITSADTFGRFRWSTTQGLDTTTAANDGEVEDYQIAIALPIYDYGDAPDTGAGTGTGNYQTTAADNGAAQVVINAAGQILSIGNTIDTDNGNAQNADATADDTLDSSDDEDGITTFPTLSDEAAQTYTISVPVRNSVPLTNAYLVGYIDFDRDGSFDDSNEQSNTATITPNANGDPQTVDLTFTTPAGMTPGNTFVRLRLGQVQATAEQATGAGASIDNGEIEDYRVEIASADGNRPLGFPFSCDSTFYITIGAGGSNPQFLYRVNRAGETYTFNQIGSSTSATNGYPVTFRYNALAYNPVDNYLYGMISNGSGSGPYVKDNIVKIGSDGVLHSIGIPTDGSGGTLPASGYYAASILSDGTYVIGRGSAFAKLDVTTSPPTILSAGTISGASFTDFAVDPTDPTSLSGAKVYGIDETTDTLVILNVTGNTPTIDSRATNPTGQDHNTGSQFVDSFGTLYYRSNSDQKLYQVDSDSNSPNYGVATEIATAPSGGNHDGASCLFSSAMEKDVRDLDGNPITTSPAGETVEYVYSIASGNVNDLNGITFEDDLRTVAGGNPINGTFNGNFSVSNGSGTVSFSNNNQTIQISNLTIPAQAQDLQNIAEKVTITAEVAVSDTLTPGSYFNQSSITNLPPQYPPFIFSDYPTSPAYEDPTPLEITAPVASDPELLLAKRITAINPGQSGQETLFNSFVNNGTNNDEDNNPNWPGSQNNGETNTYTVGATNGGQVKPEDIVEYTIYFLSSGDEPAENVLVCDLIPENMEFVPNGFENEPAATNGTPGAARGLLWEYNATIESLTNGTDGDSGYYFPPGVDPTSVFPDVKCGDPNQPNNNGAVVVGLDNLPEATAPGTPTNSYGFIRFRARVK